MMTQGTELMKKIEELPTKTIGLILAIVYTVGIGIVTIMTGGDFILRIDGNTALLLGIVGAIIVLLAGGMRKALQMIWGGFKFMTLIFPYYFVDVVAGIAWGLIVALIVFSFAPIIPVLLDRYF